MEHPHRIIMFTASFDGIVATGKTVPASVNVDFTFDADDEADYEPVHRNTFGVDQALRSKALATLKAMFPESVIVNYRTCLVSH